MFKFTNFSRAIKYYLKVSLKKLFKNVKLFLSTVVEVSFDSMEFMLVLLPSTERGAATVLGSCSHGPLPRRSLGLSGPGVGWRMQRRPCWGTGAGGGMQDDL